jgi:hypothetical protein
VSGLAGTVGWVRTAVRVDEQRVGNLGSFELCTDLGAVLADKRERRLPEVDVGDAHQRQPLERTIGPDEVLDEFVPGGHQQLCRGRVLSEAAALTQDGDPVPHLDRLVDVVGDEQNRLPDLCLEPQELVLKLLPVDRVDRPEGLVHEHHRWVGGERSGYADPLLLTARELRGVAVHELGIERDQLHQPGDARLAAVRVPAEQLRHGRDVLADRPVREEPDLLDDVADLAPELGRRAVLDRVAGDRDLTLADLDRPVDHPHRGRLPAARGSYENADLACGDLQREVVHRRALRPGVGLAHLVEDHGRGRHGLSSLVVALLLGAHRPGP